MMAALPVPNRATTRSYFQYLSLDRRRPNTAIDELCGRLLLKLPISDSIAH
jgi:hypothetical protein